MHPDRGFSMIEVLVTLVVIAVGLLGLGALQTRAHLLVTESHQRAQALSIVEDMANRIMANREAAECYVTNNGTAFYIGTGNTVDYTCTAYGTSASREVANQDLAELEATLQGEAETVDDGGTVTNVGAMLNARACVTLDSATTETYTIAVVWQGYREVDLPDGVARNACATDQYPNEKLRRVVTTTIRIAKLS